jgi:hypothetical protein
MIKVSRHAWRKPCSIGQSRFMAAPKQLGQLRDIGCNPSRLILAEQLGCGPPD